MIFQRQPRLIPEYRTGTLDLQRVTPMPMKPEISWFSVLITPIVMIIVTIVVFVASSKNMVSNPIYLLSSLTMTGMSIIGSLIAVNTQYTRYNREKKSRYKKYTAYIRDKEAELKLASELQKEALIKIHPSPQMCLERMANRAAQLWERTQDYGDFLTLRVGIGNVDAALKVAAGQEQNFMETDPLAAEIEKLSHKYEKVTEVPVTMDLMRAEIGGVAGKRADVLTMVNNMMIQTVTHHGYDDVRIIILASEDMQEALKWMRFLPHVWNADMTMRYIICGRDMARQTIGEVYKVLNEREAKGTNATFDTYYLFLVDDRSILDEEQIRRFIYEPSGDFGVLAVFTADTMAQLPAKCNAVVYQSEQSAQIIDKVSGEQYIFKPDQAIRTEFADSAARKTAPLRIKTLTSSFSLPKSITLTEMLGVKEVDTVNVAANWQKNRPYNGMSVPIGVRIGGSQFHLDLHETGHGPHGLAAGTTGSGKSELLQTIIISLAMNYHPHDLVFVLIDYKGGGMADVFKGMPHLAGVITNLGGSQTTRALLSIKGEILRRQREFARFEVNNIDKYQRKYYREKDYNPDIKPIPHLVMIADEFAELMADRREFIQELVSAARVGRSLGIHLILATQKPDGVVDDQIWSNSKFKLCLKVQTESDSNGVLKTPDAAFIKEPGRAYLKVGNDEIYELFQSAYSGADYIPDGAVKTVRANNIYELSLNGKPTQIYPLANSERGEDTDKPYESQLTAMVTHIVRAAAGIEPLEGPWTEPLSDTVYLDALLSQPFWERQEIASHISVPIGIADNPRAQKQIPVSVDFEELGHLLVYGAPSSGKTYLLRTLCTALAYSYTPKEVNLYIIDFAGGGFRRLFNDFPHCGGVLLAEEEHQIRQLADFFDKIIKERKSLFDSSYAESFSEYRKKGNLLPSIVVVIDNYFALSESYEDIDEKFLALVRNGQKYGVYFVITAANPTLIRYKMSMNYKQQIALQMIDASDYSTIVGRTDGLEPDDVKGRGLVKIEGSPLEVQFALPYFKDEPTESLLSRIASHTNDKAKSIPIMPDTISFTVLNKDVTDSVIHIGLYEGDLSHAVVDFTKYTAFIITGGSGCGKSTLAAMWLTRIQNARIYALDSDDCGLMNLMPNENVIDISEYSSEEQQEEISGEIEKIIAERRADLIQARKNNVKTDEVSSKWEQIIFVFDRFTEFAENDDFDTLKDLIDRIVKKERGLKISVIALDTLDNFSDSYETVNKAVKNEQNGILLGSIKEQNLYDVKVPYGYAEKELQFGDGYYITKGNFAPFRAAL